MIEWHLVHNSVDRREKFHYFVESVLGLNDRKGLIEELTEKFSKLTRQAIIDCPFVEGAKDFLEYIQDRMVIFLVSATPQLDLNEIIEERNMGKYFKELYGAPIDKVEVLKKIMKSENVSPDKMFFIGDSPEDENVAHRLGIHFMGIDSGRSLSNEKFPVFSDFNEVKQYTVHQYEL
jgi:phosphoglycolate phosphatase-like HAD superfamily hydrolase